MPGTPVTANRVISNEADHHEFDLSSVAARWAQVTNDAGASFGKSIKTCAGWQPTTARTLKTVEDAFIRPLDEPIVESPRVETHNQ